MSDIQLHCGDCLDFMRTLPAGSVDAVITDPPYGIEYQSSMTGHHGGTSLPGIVGDDNTLLRDRVVEWASGLPMLIFGSWKKEKPAGCHTVLTWNKGNHVGMGDLSVPWKPNTEEIYVIGSGFNGKRESSVLNFNAPVSWNCVRFGRRHPHEKPLALMMYLLQKLPKDMVIFVPFMGSGTTGVACVKTGRNFIGCELDEGYFAIAQRRIAEAQMQPLLLEVN